MRLQDCDDVEPVPVEGMEVEEVRDADTIWLFLLEWRRRLREQPTAGERLYSPGGMIGA